MQNPPGVPFQPVPEPRLAATLVILRDRNGRLEVLLTRRPDHFRFMGGAVVFPGGALDAGDCDPGWAYVSQLRPEEAAAMLGDRFDPAVALGLFVCALREAAEEVGFLADPTPGARGARNEAHDPERFLRAWLSTGETLPTGALAPAGRWVTPLGAPVRFDTQFFVARAEAEWEPVSEPREVAACWWQTPPAALEDLGAGQTVMAPPTIEMLQRLAEVPSVDAAVTSLQGPASPSSISSTRLSPLVHVVLAPNPGVMTGPGTNTYVVGSGGRTLVLDPAVDDPVYLDSVLDAAGGVAGICVTHRHSDHVGGVAALVARTGAPVYAYGREPIGGIDVVPAADGDVIGDASLPLQVIHTPGHARDHLCFYISGAASLFSGDTVLGEGTAVIAPPEGDMAAYLDSLRRLRELHIDRIYPGHFRALDGGAAVLDAYLDHRAARERAIVDAVASGAEDIDDIVARVYAGTAAALLPAAALSARAHLDMLEAAGAVTRAGERWTIATTRGRA